MVQLKRTNPNSTATPPNKKIAISAVKQSPFAIFNQPELFLGDIDIARIVLHKDITLFTLFDDTITSDRQFIIELLSIHPKLIKYNPDFERDKELVLIALRKQPALIKKIYNYRDDIDVGTLCVRHSVDLVKCFAELFDNYDFIMMSARINYKKTMSLTDTPYRNDKEFEWLSRDIHRRPIRKMKTMDINFSFK